MKSLVALAGALVIAGIVGSWLRISAQNPDKPNARTSGGQVRFTDVTGKSGIRFTHNHGGSGRHYYAETMSGGGAFLDYDGDGWLDILLLQGAPLPGTQTSQNLKPHLYRNKRDGTFDETTDSAGLADSYYGMGAATGDYNRDGRTDLYITSLAGNRLYRNEGGRFREVTKLAGVGGKDMSTSAAWLDYDRDGFLDLFVCRYMDYEVETNPRCKDARGRPAYCSPNVYEGTSSRLYRNKGDGTFADASVKSGISRHIGRSMGAAFLLGFLNGICGAEFYVANLSAPKPHFRHTGKLDADLATWIRTRLGSNPTCLLASTKDVFLIIASQMKYSVLGAAPDVIELFEKRFGGAESLKRTVTDYVDQMRVGTGLEDLKWAQDYLLKWSGWA